MKRIQTLAQLDVALAAGTFLVFIHSLLSETSTAIFLEYERWSTRRPGTPTGWIDADADPLLALTVCERTGLQPAFPQAIFLRNGRPSWSASHSAITQASLGSAYGWPLPARPPAGVRED